MANPYFKFKQFTVHQERATLKVSTDSCLFGAWCADKIAKGQIKHRHILDIGSGTGLLMLMLAQKSDALIDGIEIDHDTCIQARENLAASPWHDRLQLFEGDVRAYSFSKQYDLIVSNPPFFEGDLKPVAHSKRIAKHDETLTLEDLLDVLSSLMHDDSKFACLMPFHRRSELIEVAREKGLFLAEEMQVKQTTRHDFFRSIMMFGKSNVQLEIESIAIQENGVYTAAFVELLRDYYLYL
ncbi:MAG: tRNA1(Val) (adenine(37)-N6)-methyltransferase [Chitinophagaceae bacterium]